MSASKVQLLGGNFQDLQGNLLANGYLTMRLSSDEEVNDSLICSGIIIRIQLDANGNVVTSPPQSVWGNDAMSPINSYYQVTGYTVAGQIAFGPNNQQVTGSGTFDVGSWTPNSVISWSPAVQQPLLLKVNSTPNSSQTTLNLVEGANITLTDEGSGEISISATGSGIATGTNVAADLPFNAFTYGSIAVATAGYNYCQVMFGNSIAIPAISWKIGVDVKVALNGPIVEMVVIRTLRNSLKTVDITPITFGGSPTPTFSSTGLQLSDAISLSIDPAHDYYFCWSGNIYSGGTGSFVGNTVDISSAFTSFAGNTNNYGTPLSAAWSSSVGGGSGFGTAFPIGAGAYWIASWQSA